MDKNTLSNYGWIVIAVLVLSVMIALSTPFGNYIKDAVATTTQGLFDTNLKALESVGVDASSGFYETKTVEFDGVDKNTVWSKAFYGVAFNGYDTYYKSVTKGEKYKLTTSVVHNTGYAAVIVCDTNNQYYDSILPYSPDMTGNQILDFVVPCDGYIRVCTSVNPALEQYVGKTFNPDGQKNYYVSVNGSMATIRTTYDKDNDIIFVFGKGGGNNLPDFREVYTVSNKVVEPNTTLATERFIFAVGDMTGPHIVKAVENGDGDNPDAAYFTGGNHRTNNLGTGGAITARNDSFEVLADGKVVTDETYCNNVVLKWTNYVQAYNTTKSTGDGREVMKEDVVMTIKGCRIETSITHTALEKIDRTRYYGLQLMNGGFKTIKYIGGASDTEYNISENSNSENQTARSFIVKTSTGSACEVGIYDTGLGDFTHCGSMNSIFVNTPKTYFSLIGNTSFVQETGDTTLVKGYYDFTKK